MARRRLKFTDQLREAIDGSGMSRYAICKAIGLSQATMSRFMSGRGGLSVDVLDRLADCLRLSVVGQDRVNPKGKG